MGIESRISSIQWARFFPEHRLFFSKVFASTNFVRTNFHSFDFLSIRFVVRECIWWHPVHWDEYQRPLLKRLAPVSWMLCPLPWRFSCRLALLLCFPRSHAASSRAGCCGCCCCCASQLLFNVTLGAGLGVASLSNVTRSPVWEITRSMQSPGTVALVMIANDFVCQNCNPWSCALDNFIQCSVFTSRNYSTPQSGLRLPRNSFVKDVLLQWYDPSSSRSSWSWWRTIFCDHLGYLL